MSLNIQTATGLLEIGGKVTKEKVISALGYEPADKAHTTDKTVHVTSAEKEIWNNKSDVKHYEDLEGAPSITENDSGNMVIADESGNIIMQVDADGLATTNVSARTISLGGEDLGIRLDELEASKVSNIVEDESGKVEFTDEAGNVIARINVDGFETTTVTAKSAVINGVDIGTKLDEYNEAIDGVSGNLTTHTSNSTIHVTADERDLWNNKSDFSGDYNDLTNAPDIKEDNSGEIVYADESGNVIAKIGENGFETTQVIANNVVAGGVNLGSTLSSHINESDGRVDKLHITKAERDEWNSKASVTDLDTHISDMNTHVTSSEKETWNNKSNFSGDYSDLTGKPNVLDDESSEFNIADQNGNVVLKVDANGLHTTSVEANSLILNGEDIAEKIDMLASSSNDDCVKISSIADDLETADKNKVLSANQGVVLNDQITEINRKLADLMYEAITISSFTHNAGTKERGSTVTNVTLSWDTNKTPTTLVLDGESLDVGTTSKVISGLAITWDNNKTWKLDVTDERGKTATKSTSITFCNNIYYGVGAIASGFDSAFVTSLSKRLQTAKAYDFTVNPTAQYIYYAVPTRLGTVSFKVGGFEGGFEAPETVSVTNGSNYTENYYVYRSTNTITGSTTVDVT